MAEPLASWDFFKVRKILHSLVPRMSGSEDLEEKGTKMEHFPVEL